TGWGTVLRCADRVPDGPVLCLGWRRGARSSGTAGVGARMPRQGFEPLTAYEHMVIWLGMSKPILSHRAIELLAARFRILGDPTRLALLQHLQHDELSVSELTQLSGTSQPNVSKHLKHM